MLSDFWPHGAVSAQYGVFQELVGAASRATFLIDKDGVLRWQVLNGWDVRYTDAYKKALAEVGD